MSESGEPLLKRLADGDLQAVGRHPLQLWLLPIHFRSHDKYYRDLIEAVKKRLEEAWELHGHLYASRQEFEESDFVRNTWRFHSPYWWGLADIIGFVDIRASVAEKSVNATLFLTTKRASSRLVDKTYVAKRQESVHFDNASTNESLRSDLSDAVGRIAADPLLRRRHLDLEAWVCILEHTDLVGILRAEVRSVLTSLSQPSAV